MVLLNKLQQLLPWSLDNKAIELIADIDANRKKGILPPISAKHTTEKYEVPTPIVSPRRENNSINYGPLLGFALATTTFVVGSLFFSKK